MKDLNGNDIGVGDPVSWRASHTRGFRRGTVRRIHANGAVVDDGDPCNPDLNTNGMHVSEVIGKPAQIKRKMKGWTRVEAYAWLLHNGFNLHAGLVVIRDMPYMHISPLSGDGRWRVASRRAAVDLSIVELSTDAMIVFVKGDR